MAEATTEKKPEATTPPGRPNKTPIYEYVVLEQSGDEQDTFYKIDGLFGARTPGEAEEAAFQKARKAAIEDGEENPTIGPLVAILANKFKTTRYEVEVTTKVKRQG